MTRTEIRISVVTFKKNAMNNTGLAKPCCNSAPVPGFEMTKLVVVNIDHALDIQTMHPVVLECVVQLSCFKPNASD